MKNTPDLVSPADSTDVPSQRFSQGVPRANVEGDDGIDVSLIHWTLSLNPHERMDVLRANSSALVRLRNVAATQC